MPVVKYGRSRQLTVPKEYHEKLGVKSGDVFDVELKEETLVYTPKTLIDKVIEERLEEGLADIREGRT
ncbi:MAG TPA: AbrB/MazE/SpoVT family DNA-binding domain-containing protein [candidate division Zixibacteria bacterium]|jgi:bifunctional DNA-binding transcriptional regulator/antitoxin component of YhaV-PrlF toxin-antitoxin module|nr:AbrB/MazE/SpoVT family DNA-binding domain-containing protein [candidate division Zixibacteria bacterium]